MLAKAATNISSPNSFIVQVGTPVETGRTLAGSHCQFLKASSWVVLVTMDLLGGKAAQLMVDTRSPFAHCLPPIQAVQRWAAGL